MFAVLGSEGLGCGAAARANRQRKCVTPEAVGKKSESARFCGLLRRFGRTPCGEEGPGGLEALNEVDRVSWADEPSDSGGGSCRHLMEPGGQIAAC